MDQLKFIQWCFAFTGLFFIVAFGCICGSFINVLVYRLPRGLNIVTPPSACPHCETRLTWRENFPIFGWLALRGRCRFCKSPISAEYPIVEFIVGALFAGIWAAWFMNPSIAGALGVKAPLWRPDFAAEGVGRMWPMLLVIYALLGSFTAATLIDLRTFTIPLALPWFVTVLALLIHPLHAAWVQFTGGLHVLPFTWTIPVPTGGGLGAAYGGAAGILLSVALLRLRILPQSFADYPQWEESALARDRALIEEPPPASQAAAGDLPMRTVLVRTLFLTGPAIALMFLGMTLGIPRDRGVAYAFIGMAIGLVLGLILRRLAPGPDGASDEPVWAGYPHVRREMFKEILFLLPAIALGTLGWWLCRRPGPLGDAAFHAPLWALALGGSLLGYLVGGGIVWLFRLGGSLALNKEAMGLGDVHLMAAAGAALGWIDPLLAFFTAPFLGIGWAVLSVFFRQVFHRQGTALPYGPHLALATAIVLLLKPLYELGLSTMLGRDVNIP